MPLRDVPVPLRVPETIRKAYTVPGRTALRLARAAGDNTVRCVVPEVQCHRAVVFEY